MYECLFTKKSHICLIENHWLDEEKIALSNFWILEDNNEEMLHYASTTHAYNDQKYIP